MKDNKKTANFNVYVTPTMAFLLSHNVIWQEFMALSKIPNALQQSNSAGWWTSMNSCQPAGDHI